MSVCLSAIMSHHWQSFSREAIDQVAHAACSEAPPPRWRLISESSSAENDFARSGLASFRLLSGFTLRFARATLSLNHDDRWSALLVHREVRERFLSACRRVAHVAGAAEILVLPEGTVLEDSLYEGAVFDEIKNRAKNAWGPPDPDVSRIYGEEE